MSAVMNAAPSRNRLEFSGLDRRLSIEVASGTMSACVFPLRKTESTFNRMVAYASADLSTCRLDMDRKSEEPAPCLWLGRAAFDLTTEEALTIAQRFDIKVQG